ncbi:hypothetical protein GCM10011491_29330 [Brucella endophytica]|uniref:Lysozyme inhibitor LprI N-terminal domain-containing protein n=1 Tax=Brucella endophytica TaxID=1963359 RepID=A0A916SHF9_9HYPH|nr:hypothetical protein [Brucella endophytica]GGA99221.1 hypothetical protein GCM10011491_29330 [Brucella endophytica]
MENLRNILAAAGVFLAVTSPDVGRTQSFACSKAVSRTELAICASSQLSYFDTLVVQAYRFALKDPKGNAKEVNRTQKLWLEQRNRCGGNYACLLAAYQNRLQRIETLHFADTRVKSTSAARAVPACKPSDVRIVGSVVGDGGGTISNVYYFTYRGKACRVVGYPALSAYTETGKPKPNGVDYENSARYTTQPPPEIEPIILSASNPSAWFLVEAAGGCDTGVRVKVALPRSRKWLTTMDFPGGGCTSVDVSPVRPMSTLLPPP